jgi:hypothetical protein
MIRFAEICGFIVWVGIVFGCAGFSIEGINSGDKVQAWAGAFFLVAVLGLTAFAVANVRNENVNPCVAWGEPVTTWMLVGKTLTPTTYTPCIRRQNEVQR